MALTPETTKRLLTEKITGYTVVRDGFMPGSGYLPGYRVVGVKMDGKGKANLDISTQLYLLEEAFSIVEDKTREELKL